MCYIGKVVVLGKDKVMLKSIEDFFAVKLVLFLAIFFLIIYISVTKNVLDFCYLIFVVIYCFSIRYCKWKKYH